VSEIGVPAAVMDAAHASADRRAYLLVWNGWAQDALQAGATVAEARAAATQRLARCDVAPGAVIEFRELPGEAGGGDQSDG